MEAQEAAACMDSIRMAEKSSTTDEFVAPESVALLISNKNGLAFPFDKKEDAEGSGKDEVVDVGSCRDVGGSLQLDGMDALLTSLGSPGYYQVVIFLALASCMFPVVFNDLSTIFYTIHPLSSTCSLSPLSNDTVMASSSSLLMLAANSSSLTKRLNDTNNTILRTVYGADDSCVILERLPEASPEANLCWRTMQHTFQEPAVWSIVSEWNLVCQNYWQVSFATTIYFVGVMTGSMMFGHLADRLGRFRCIMACYVGYLPFGIALSFVEHYWLFLLLRFCIGFFIQGVQSVCFVLVMEYSSPAFRPAVGGLEGLIGGLGVGALSGIAYWWQDWRSIQLCLTIPTILALTKVLFLRESLRWQMVQGKVTKAKESILAICRWNNLKPDAALDEKLKKMSDALLAEQQLEASYTWLDCFRTPRMRKYTIAQSFIWFTVLFVYYGISFSINDLEGNMYLNLIAGSAAEIPVYIVTVYFMHRFGRRKPLVAFFGSCGVLCLVVAGLSGDFKTLLDWQNGDVAVIRTAIVFLARFSLAGTYTVVFVYGSELFPTVLRNTAFGICICCHTFGGVVTPQVILLGKTFHEAVPFVVFGVCCLLSCLLVLTQPETLNRKMPDTIEEVEGRQL